MGLAGMHMGAGKVSCVFVFVCVCVCVTLTMVFMTDAGVLSSCEFHM